MNERRMKREKGQSLVEFALLLPILLIILIGVVDLGRMYYAYTVITDAAAEGATYAAMNPNDVAEIENRARAACGDIDAGIQLVEVTCPTCPSPASGDVVTVSISYDYVVLTPFMDVLFKEGTVPIQSQATEVILSGER
jgi:Flp pilus assembly protein TadG